MCPGLHRFSLWVTACLALMASLSPVGAQCSPDPWADFVVQSSPTAGDPMWVLGAPDGMLAGFEEVSGSPGFVTVEFLDDVVVDGPGDDFAIHVVDFAAIEVVEAFELFVSDDGVVFTSLGTVFPTSPFQNFPETLSFDLNGSGVTALRQVMVVGLTVDAAHLGEGVDIDAFEALNCATPSDTDLMDCLDGLDACMDELGTCESELNDANAGWDACRIDLDQAQTDLGGCEDALNAADASLDEGQAGLVEIQRLIALPPGLRRSSFTCSGELCVGIQQAIEMLVSAPGQSIRRGRGGGRR